ncbi:hypothetical protein ACFFX0_26600 [Citricoccus parietis]|uniref:Uncharacterized protein n=1 Tax=Citricoccus parietis TaxID=592307 RepID=A0ABV5G6I6_9MICC
MLAIGCRGGVPLVRRAGEGIVRQVERGVVELELPGAVAHVHPGLRVLEPARGEGAAVGQDQPRVADLEVIVVLARVDLRGRLGPRINGRGQRVVVRDVVERNRDRDGLGALVGALIEDVQLFATGQHPIAEVVVRLRGLEGEHRFSFQGGRRLDRRAVDHESDRILHGVSGADQRGSARQELAILEVEPYGGGVGALHGHPLGVGGDLLGPVRDREGVFEPALAGEVGLRQAVGIEVLLVGPLARLQTELLGSIVGIGAQVQGDGADQHVVGDPCGEAERLCRVDGPAGRVLHHRLGGIGGQAHGATGQLRSVQ